MLDGMTMFLASGDKNKPKAARKARDVAYWEDRSKNKEPSSWENTSADLKKLSNTTYNATASAKTSDSSIESDNKGSFSSQIYELQKQKQYAPLLNSPVFLPPVPIPENNKPTTLEAAELAEQVYSIPKTISPKKYKDYKVSDWNLFDYYNNEEGLNIGVYRKELNGTTRHYSYQKEIFEKYGIRIISWDLPDPIANTFK